MARIVVLGAAESGVGAAVLAQKKGFDVFVSDMGKVKQHYAEMLDNYGIAWEDGRHTETLILNADEVIKSPGIPDEAPMIKKIKAAGIPIISEIEFAGRYTQAKMVCITGSNGKTTTTSLVYHILKNAGLNVGLAGNIGQSLALQVAESEVDCYVIELSSFQLDNMYEFRANVAVLLNITPDHLDRYGFEMQNYVDSKMRILQNQQENDAFIYWANDPIVSVELPKYQVRSKMCPFSILTKEGMAAYVADEQYVLKEPVCFSFSQEKLSLSGKHNLYNSLAAGLAARQCGVSDEDILKGLMSFKGVEHRLEKVATRGGIEFINDSKATNVDACWYALDSMTQPTILIVGGKDKGNDYQAIAEMVKKKCKGLVFLGADNQKLRDFFADFGIPTADTHSMKECVDACMSMACPGDVVLLSPCCASFDLFKNMEDRGEQFKELVKNI